MSTIGLTRPAAAITEMTELTDDHGPYRLLTTFRRSGEGVGTPVWFAVDGHTMYVKTGVRSGKVKRIAAEPRVTVAPCTMRGKLRGEAIGAVARIVTDPEEETRTEAALSSKYGPARPLILGYLHKRGVEELYVAIERG